MSMSEKLLQDYSIEQVLCDSEAVDRKASLLKETMNKLMHSDVRQEFSATDFRKIMDPENKDNFLVDLTFNLINVAIERGYKKKKLDTGSSPTKVPESVRSPTKALESVRSPSKAPESVRSSVHSPLRSADRAKTISPIKQEQESPSKKI